MNYWELNKWTKRDNNSLPNIKIILENLWGGELFSTFDLHWGYKNLQIKLEDWTKAAFKTVFGTFILNVTYFGLTNAPLTFQRVVHLDLWPLLQKYPRKLGNYLDDLWIITKKDAARQKTTRTNYPRSATAVRGKFIFPQAKQKQIRGRNHEPARMAGRKCNRCCQFYILSNNNAGGKKWTQALLSVRTTVAQKTVPMFCCFGKTDLA